MFWARGEGGQLATPSSGLFLRRSLTASRPIRRTFKKKKTSFLLKKKIDFFLKRKMLFFLKRKRIIFSLSSKKIFLDLKKKIITTRRLRRSSV